MFSVDNFYEFFSSHYGWDNSQTMPWIFSPHGSKNLWDLVAYYDWGIFKQKIHHYNFNGALIMHDQEPFMPNMLDTYRANLLEDEKMPWLASLSHKELLLLRLPTCSWPIFCHSEINSKDIEFVNDSGMIPCYYFWHALISRDWFRHWKHHKDLQQTRNWSKRFLLYAREHTGTREYRQSLIEHLIPFKDQVEYNWDNQNIVDSSYSAKIVVQDANTTAVHIVAETVFDCNKIHLTEKVFKPIVMSQPFVLFAGAGALAYLQRYGFKTFDSVWDESYDLVVNHSDRFQMVLTLIKKLNDMPLDDFKLLIRKCQQIVEYNRQHFFSDNFEKILLDELHQNVQTALAQQTEKNLSDPGGCYYWLMNSLREQNYQLNATRQQSIVDMTAYIKQNHNHQYQQIAKQYPWIIF
jgi:hypothetical protein